MLIREQDRKALTEIFSKMNRPIEVWAYGSRVNGTAHDTSDLDLVLRTIDLSPLAFDEFETMAAVSYTHLDVYKRQSLMGS